MYIIKIYKMCKKYKFIDIIKLLDIRKNLLPCAKHPTLITIKLYTSRNIEILKMIYII